MYTTEGCSFELLWAFCIPLLLFHLLGTLFIDHVSALKRKMYARRVAKQMKQQ